MSKSLIFIKILFSLAIIYLATAIIIFTNEITETRKTIPQVLTTIEQFEKDAKIKSILLSIENTTKEIKAVRETIPKILEEIERVRKLTPEILSRVDNINASIPPILEESKKIRGSIPKN